MKITVKNLNGRAIVAFFRDGESVHTETFKGKATMPFVRTVEFDGEYDEHKAVLVMGDLDFSYEVTP